jgi:hypothetical protein
MEDFCRLSEVVGPEAVSWRYDPILLTEKYSLQYHLEAFREMAEKLRGSTGQVVISFLDLYEKYRDLPSKGNPLSAISDDIIIQAGWYSLLYRLDLYKRFPYLASAVRKARIRGNSDVCILCQLIVKLISLFRV